MIVSIIRNGKKTLRKGKGGQGKWVKKSKIEKNWKFNNPIE
ncbi:hypothetical protein FLA_6323 [Filimonas lacunae]|nr:hypothetical protein FLA_6323 [Filimonas lacunae]